MGRGIALVAVGRQVMQHVWMRRAGTMPITEGLGLAGWDFGTEEGKPPLAGTVEGLMS
jgi:hypothetical protein